MSKILFLLTMAALSLTLFSGCGQRATDSNSEADGNAGFVVSEINNMGETALGFNQMAGKTLSSLADTYYVIVDITPWHYDSSAGAWVRECRMNYPAGERVRKDTVCFYNSLGGKVQTPSLAVVDSIVHKRNVVRTRNGNEVTVNLCMKIVLNKPSVGDTMAVKNGTII